MTETEDDQNGRQPKRKTTETKDDRNGRQPKRKTTEKEDDWNGRLLKRKTTETEDDRNGRRPKRKKIDKTAYKIYCFILLLHFIIFYMSFVQLVSFTLLKYLSTQYSNDLLFNMFSMSNWSGESSHSDILSPR